MQLNKLKPATTNNEGTTLTMSNKNFNKSDLPHESFLTTRQITKLRNKISNNISADIKLSKAQISKTVQHGRFLGKLLGRFLPKLIKPAISLLTNIGLPLRLSAADTAIQKSIFSGSGPQSGGNKIDEIMNVLRVSRNGLNSMMKIIKAPEDNNILPKGITATTKNEVKSQRNGFLPMLLGSLASGILGNMLFGSGIKRAGEGLFRAGQGIKKIINVSTSFNKY